MQRLLHWLILEKNSALRWFLSFPGCQLLQLKTNFVEKQRNCVLCFRNADTGSSSSSPPQNKKISALGKCICDLNYYLGPPAWLLVRVLFHCRRCHSPPLLLFRRIKKEKNQHLLRQLSAYLSISIKSSLLTAIFLLFSFRLTAKYDI